MLNLLARLRQTGLLVLIGLVVILYVGLGFLYFQQSPKQQKFIEQTNQLLVVAARPLPSVEKLKADYDEVNRSLAPIPVLAVLDIIVGMAKESGINIDTDADKFRISPPGNPVEVKVGGGKYQALLFKAIKVQGEHSRVMAFIALLDSGAKLKTMVLTKVEIGDVQIFYKGEEAARRKEFNTVLAAIAEMMAENNLSSIPNPKNYASGNATNDMAAFPDHTSTWSEAAGGGKLIDPKGNPYKAGDKEGYVLYGHDFKAGGGQTGLVNYFGIPKTKYYYTSETDGKVRQFSAPDVKTATEYTDSRDYIIETLAIVDIDLYSKLPEVPKPTQAPKSTQPAKS